jgi:hypothetical protein
MYVYIVYVCINYTLSSAMPVGTHVLCSHALAASVKCLAYIEYARILPHITISALYETHRRLCISCIKAPALCIMKHHADILVCILFVMLRM